MKSFSDLDGRFWETFFQGSLETIGVGTMTSGFHEIQDSSE